jgi:hypothetical protein
MFESNMYFMYYLGVIMKLTVTQADARVITSFRRTKAAEVLRALLERELASRRATNEGSTASTENQIRVQQAKDLLALLFDSELRLK